MATVNEKFIIFLVFVGLTVAQNVPFKFDDEQGIGQFLFGSVNRRLYTSGYAEFADYHCQYTRRPLFKGFSLQYHATFSCPTVAGLSRITGKAKSRSAGGSVIDATRDFARKALEAKIITAEDARPWITA